MTSEYSMKWRECPQSEGIDVGFKAPFLLSLFQARREPIFTVAQVCYLVITNHTICHTAKIGVPECGTLDSDLQ